MSAGFVFDPNHMTELAQTHKAIAESMGRGVLKCATCQRVELLTLEQVEQYLGSGWPTCCGGTMGFHSYCERPTA